MLDLEQITPDSIVFWQWKLININATLVFTWGLMLLLAMMAWIATSRMKKASKASRWRMFLEMVVDKTRNQIRDVIHQSPDPYLPLIGTLFLFIATANILMIVPGYVSPTASLSTTAALAGCVFFAVPIYGISQRGLANYLKHYIKPTVFMLPFHIISELSRTLALAVRLFGNIMSGTKIVALFLAVAPFVFPIVMQALGLLTGLIQAYIFAVLALIYISSGMRTYAQSEKKQSEQS